MSDSHRDRLIATLPTDMQARVLSALQDYSSDGNDPIEACFAAVIEVHKHECGKLREDVGMLRNALVKAEYGSREHVVQVVNRIDHSIVENKKAVETVGGIVVSSLSGKSLWRRILLSRIVGAIIWTAMVVCLTTYFVKTKVRTVDPAFHAKIEDVEKEIIKRIDDQAQLQNLRISQVMDLGNETNQTIKKTYVTSARETLLGKGLSYYVGRIDEKTITLLVGERRIIVQHHLTPIEYLQLSIATQQLGSK